MLRFQYENFFWFLILIPILYWVYKRYLSDKESKLHRYFNAQNLSQILQRGDKNKNASLLKLGAIAALIIAITNLQAGSYNYGLGKSKGGDVMVALDISNSMSAEDVSPSRIELSKLFLQKLLQQAGSDRLGLLYFAWESQIAMPLSKDHITFEEQLSKMEPGMARVQGTSIARALEEGLTAFNQSGYKHKALLLITDGEDHEEGIDALLRKYKNKGIKIFTVGVGSENGAPIKDPKTGKNKLDNQGNEVLSKFNEELLKEIAEKTNGSFVYLDNIRSANNEVLRDIAGMGKNVYDTSSFEAAHSYGFIFLVIAMLLLLIPYISNFKSEIKKKPSMNSIALFLVFLSYSSTAQEAENKKVNQGNSFYNKGDYKMALDYYSQALKSDPSNREANFNQGNAYFSLQNMDFAREFWAKSLQNNTNTLEKSKAYYNIGNSYCMQKNWSQAIESYKSALRLNPKDEQARYNLAYAQLMKNKENKQNQNKQDQQQNQDQKDQQKDQDKKDQQQNQDQKDQQKDQQKDNKPEDKQAPKPKPRPGEMSKEQAEQMLKALRNEQKKVKLGDSSEQTHYPPPSKDW